MSNADKINLCWFTLRFISGHQGYLDQIYGIVTKACNRSGDWK